MVWGGLQSRNILGLRVGLTQQTSWSTWVEYLVMKGLEFNGM